jgi:hypothetical protein
MVTAVRILKTYLLGLAGHELGTLIVPRTEKQH